MDITGSAIAMQGLMVERKKALWEIKTTLLPCLQIRAVSRLIIEQKRKKYKRDFITFSKASCKQQMETKSKEKEKKSIESLPNKLSKATRCSQTCKVNDVSNSFKTINTFGLRIPLCL